jgi:molybdenum-dependent DNA-binding transcriptional regulator ModE
MDRLQAMETFVRVVETGSFSSAARQLGLGQPAVSKLVAGLEDAIGVRLLVRTTRQLSTTQAGQMFYERARRALAEADEAFVEARGADAGELGVEEALHAGDDGVGRHHAAAGPVATSTQMRLMTAGGQRVFQSLSPPDAAPRAPRSGARRHDLKGSDLASAAGALHESLTMSTS